MRAADAQPDASAPIAEEEARALFADCARAQTIALAVSGGPDSTALLVLAARWRGGLARGPKLIALTVDHGLRPDAPGEARAVGALARRLKVAHRTLRWRGPKPASGVQEAARAARYRLLAQAARRAGARHLLTAHTRDDQAETVLFRLARGSGLAGLAGMRRCAPLGADGLPLCAREGRAAAAPLDLVRPFLDVPKARLEATLAAEGIEFAQDPSNLDARFARPRWRALMPLLEREGLDPRRLSAFAKRAARAHAALERATDEAQARVASGAAGGPILLDARAFAALPEEIALRLLGRAIAQVGREGPVRLQRLERLLRELSAALAGPAGAGFRRTLAGALIGLRAAGISVATAPARSMRPANAIPRGGERPRKK